MKSKHTFIGSIAAAFMLVWQANPVVAQTKSPPSLSPFGTKPIQLSISKEGITRKEGGYICDVDASISNAHYSEWGETEKDARTIVLKECSKHSGLLLCKKEKVTCKEDK